MPTLAALIEKQTKRWLGRLPPGAAERFEARRQKSMRARERDHASYLARRRSRHAPDQRTA